jgi:GNAT superfamily N-acetyltransferase
MIRPTLRLVHRLRDASRTMGIARLAWTAPRWSIRREFLITVKDLTGALPPISPVPGVSWRRLAGAEVPALVASSSTLCPAEVWRRLREGQECWVGWMGTKAAHWLWQTHGETHLPYLHRSVRPLDGDLWVVEVYTHPSERRRGLYTTSIVMAMHRARERGYVRLIGLIAAWNTPARRVAEEKLQRAVVGTVGYWAFGWRRSYFVTGSARLDDGEHVCVPARPGVPPSPGAP